jgi:transglutaminase-like putative cysteine protease
MHVSEREPTYLEPTEFIDSDAPAIRAYAARVVGDEKDPIRRVLLLYRAVRDGIAYDPYVDYNNSDVFRASGVLAAGRGFCIGKATVFAACARALGIPARLGFADVRNHLTSRRLYERVKSNVFRWHCYAEVKLAGAWVKATPAFDAALCVRAGIEPLEFDGKTDSLFQPFDPSGRRHMEYLADRGTFADVPHAEIMRDFRIYYAGLMTGPKLTGDFAAEAVADELGDQSESVG